MTTKTKASSTATAAPNSASANDSATSAEEDKRRISPAERWLLITENVHARAQRRGFVGGDPCQDLLEAEREIDATYDTDFEGVFTLTDPKEIAEQFKSVFAGYGFGHSGLDGLLAKHRDGLEKLAASNSKVISSTSELATKQTALLQDVAAEAVKTLQSAATGRLNTDGVARQAELSTQAMENALSLFQALTDSVAEIATPTKQAPAYAGPCAPPDISIRGAFEKAYEGKTLTELAEAPVAALKGVTEAHAREFRDAFQINTIRDLATTRLAEWARGIVTLADTQANGGEGHPVQVNIDEASDKAPDAKTLTDIADAPIEVLHDISDRQAKLLRDAFHIETVRDFANNPFFSVARAIVMLADAEQ